MDAVGRCTGRRRQWFASRDFTPVPPYYWPRDRGVLAAGMIWLKERAIQIALVALTILAVICFVGLVGLISWEL